MPSPVTVTCDRRSGPWQGICDCGWSATSSGSGPSDRRSVEARGSTHLRQSHGATSPRRQWRGGKVTFLGIDERLLDKSERARYLELAAAANYRGGQSGGARPSIQMKIRDAKKSLMLLALWAAATVVSFGLGMLEDKLPEPHPDPFMWLFALVFFLGWIPVPYMLAREADAWRRKLTGDFLDEIEFEERVPFVAAARDDHDGGPVYWATGNYDPQRYYAATRGWSKEFREYVKDAYGSLDRYESNHPD